LKHGHTVLISLAALLLIIYLISIQRVPDLFSYSVSPFND